MGTRITYSNAMNIKNKRTSEEKADENEPPVTWQTCRWRKTSADRLTMEQRIWCSFKPWSEGESKREVHRAEIVTFEQMFQDVFQFSKAGMGGKTFKTIVRRIPRTVSFTRESVRLKSSRTESVASNLRIDFQFRFLPWSGLTLVMHAWDRNLWH